MSMREHFVVATAAMVVGLESQVPSIYKKQIVPLREVYGFTEDEIEFFDLHITSDVVHGERGYQIVLDHADTPELQQRCLQLVRWGAEMRFSYTRGLYDTYVAPDLEPPRSDRRPCRRLGTEGINDDAPSGSRWRRPNLPGGGSCGRGRRRAVALFQRRTRSTRWPTSASTKSVR